MYYKLYMKWVKNWIKSVNFYTYWSLHQNKIIIAMMKIKSYPTDIYLFKVNNKNTKTMCEICSKLTIKKNSDVINVLMSFSLTMNIFHTLTWCYYCWLWKSKCRLVTIKYRNLRYLEVNNKKTSCSKTLK